MNYVTVSWLIMIVIMIIVDFTGKSPPFLDTSKDPYCYRFLNGLIVIYIGWCIRDAGSSGFLSEKLSSEVWRLIKLPARVWCTERETPLFRSISSAPASESIWHPNQIVRKKTDKKLCCYRNIAATVGRFSWVSVSGMRKKIPSSIKLISQTCEPGPKPA